ncbi:MAG: dipeptide epimerase [Campylobacterota bacterium]|nr:dipeptide epimerase [Campylobacterota bacterium]
MIITKITLSHHKIPLKHPFITALRRVDTVEFLRVHIETDSTIVGIGEAPPTHAVTGETLESITQDITQVITPKLLGLSIEDAFVTLLTCKQNSASAAIDIALHNMMAQKQGVSLKSHLGAKVSHLKTAITISLDTPEIMATRAQEAFQEGLDILKIKVGAKDTKDSERIHTICRRVPKAKILIDANQAWSFEEALSIIKEISHLNISLIEQPLIADDLEGMSQLTSQSSIAILADESAFNLNEVKKVIAHKSAHMINIKLMKCGGISPAIEIIKYCEKNAITCMMGSMLEGPHSIIAAASLAMAYPETIKYIDLDSPLLYKAIASNLAFSANELSL